MQGEHDELRWLIIWPEPLVLTDEAKSEAVLLTVERDLQGGVTNADLEQYIKRQKQINQAGVNIGTFTQILDAAKALTYQDGGKQLLQGLKEYNSLSGAVTTAKMQLQSL